jgi:hypothetical protein
MFLLNKEVKDSFTPSESSFSLPARIKRTNSNRYHIEYVSSPAIKIMEQSFVEFAVNCFDYQPLGVWDCDFQTGWFNYQLVDQMFPNLDDSIEDFLTIALDRSINFVQLGYPVNNEILSNHFQYSVVDDVVQLHREKLAMDEVKTDIIRVEFDLKSTLQPKTYQFYPIGWYYLSEQTAVQDQPCYMVYTKYADPDSHSSMPVWQNPVQQLIGSDIKKWFLDKNFSSVEEAFEFTQKTIHGVRGWKNKIFRQVNKVKTEISLYEFEKLLNDKP